MKMQFSSQPNTPGSKIPAPAFFLCSPLKLFEGKGLELSCLWVESIRVFVGVKGSPALIILT